MPQPGYSKTRIYILEYKYRWRAFSNRAWEHGRFMRDDQRSDEEILKLVTEIVSAYVSKNPVTAEDLPNVIRSVHATLGGFQGAESAASARPPAVPVKKSVTPDYIVCLEDGRKLKMLKRYLRAQYGLTPEAYRAKWNLPADYPMTAPNYAARRSAFAKQSGLGKPGRRPRD
jgi:predicted transcriptional regulator